MKYLICLSLLLVSFSSLNAKTLVIVGDSLTEGYGIKKEDAYPALLEKKIQSINKDWKVISSGVSGSTTASAVPRIKWILKTKPDMVMIALGANDGLRGIKVSTSKENLDKALAILKKEKIPVIIGGISVPPNYGKKFSKEFNKMYVDLAKKYDATLIPFILEKVAGDKKYNLADGVHPNEAGHKIMAETIFQHIKKFFK